MRSFMLFCAAALAAVTGISRAQTPENAFVIILDGMRNDEAFESESTYLRRIWNDLRPLGTINTRFFDRGWTATTGGHTTILSGVYQVLNNNASNEQDIRSFDPLMFECYRQSTGAPESACGVVFGKWGNMGAVSNFGLEPSFGETWKGFQIGDPGNITDTFSSQRVHRAMDSLHPKLVMVNLGDVDHYGHQDTLANYLRAIRNADSIVYEFYKHIQAIPPYTDTFYRNKTLFIVTSDHGRHDDAHGGFKGHGDWDHGSRHIMFYAFGPGIAAGRRIDAQPRQQIDIAPTIGSMLGFPMPFAEGAVMTELFADGYKPTPAIMRGPEPGPLSLNLSNNAGFSRDPDVARDRNGNLYCVWSDNTPDKWSVFLRKSTDNGLTWQPPQTLFDYPASESLMWYARVAADDSLAVAAMGYGKHANYIDSVEPRRMDTTYLWYPWLATSADQGGTWAVKSLADSNMGSWYAPVAVKNGRYSVAWWQCGKFSWEATGKGINFNHRSAGGDWDSLPSNIVGKNSIHLTLADDGTTYHVAGSEFQGQDWDIQYARSETGDSWTKTWVCEDPDGTPMYDYDPELCVDDSGYVHIIWARKPNTGGAWQLMYGRRDPATEAWDTVGLGSPTDAWQPHIACKGETLALVWVDYRDGHSEIYCRFSEDRGLTWSVEQPVTFGNLYAEHPRVCPADQGFLVVWQAYMRDNWDVFSEPLNPHVGLAGPGAIRLHRPALPTVARNVLRLPDAGRYTLISITGRKVAQLQPGPNDIRHVPAGVYFISEGTEAVTKLVIQH
jgi:hypothetical protein